MSYSYRFTVLIKENSYDAVESCLEERGRKHDTIEAQYAYRVSLNQLLIFHPLFLKIEKIL